jgi:hypothetical protein
MGLLQLPGELLDDIITRTIPLGFQNFVLSCKTIYARGQRQIERYNRLQKQRLFASRPSNDKGKSMQLLYDISNDPALADCIDVLKLSDPAAVGESSDDSQLSDEFRMEPSVMDKIKELVTESEWIEGAGVDVKSWWENVMSEDDLVDEEDDALPFTAVSLLCQLSGLKTLQLPHTWSLIDADDPNSDEEKQLLYVLDTLIRNANESGPARCPLNQLETILPFNPLGYTSRAALQCLEPFFSLKSLKKLFGVSLVAVQDGFDGSPFHWRSEFDSSLRRVELAGCCIDSDGLSQFVAHTPQLEIFKYSHETKWQGCQYDWNPGAFLDTLGQYCGPYIKHLAVTVDILHGAIINGASSFIAFTNLETLEVDVLVFCGPPIESGQRKGQDAYVPPGDIPWTEHDIPCIGSMVPACVSRLEINTDFPTTDKQALRSLLKNIEQQKEERLHNLQEVIVRQYAGDSAKGTFGVPGLVLIVDGRSEGVQDRSMLPTWKRKFAETVGGTYRHL